MRETHEKQQKRYLYDRETKQIIGKVCASILCQSRVLDEVGEPIPIPVSLFDIERSSRDGLSSYCKECRREISDESYNIRCTPDLEKYRVAQEHRMERKKRREEKQEEEQALRLAIANEARILKELEREEEEATRWRSLPAEEQAIELYHRDQMAKKQAALADKKAGNPPKFKTCANRYCSSKHVVLRIKDREIPIENPAAILPVEHFTRDATRGDGLCVYCKDCMHSKIKNSKEANK